METHLLGPALALGEGLALVLSPCILPVLPMVLGASLEGGRARPLGIVAGFTMAFTAFAVLTRQAVLAAGLDANIVRDASLVLLAALGLVMLFPALTARWEHAFASLGNRGDALIGRMSGRGFWGGVVIGSLIGVVWTPCAGPVLAAAIVQIIQAGSGTQAVLTIAAFALGAGLPMFFIATFGRYIMQKTGFLKRHATTIRRVMGVLLLAASLTVMSGLDLKLVSWQAQAQAAGDTATAGGLKNALETPYDAPAPDGITHWINTQALGAQDLRGKVVLVDFWTYSCINCIRTLPHIESWYEKYKDKGFVVLGVHAPEFAFEKKAGNVESAVRQYGITYPVALDNDYAMWNAYQNRYWPAHYLIDRDGRVVYTHFGEGEYDVTENNIRTLLGISGPADAPVALSQDGAGPDQSPETYLGYARAENFASPEDVTRDAVASYSFPSVLGRDQWALSGPWTLAAQNIMAAADAALRYRFRGGKVYLVLGTADGKPRDVTVTLDGGAARTIHVDGEKLYTLYGDKSGDTAQRGVLELQTKGAGLMAYAFTFGR